MKEIHLWGVKQNNLKNIEVKIPLGSMTVICGPSGSGKSSLAFETLYAEGQRRYIESLSNYTKQFLNKAPKPDIEGIENIPPSIALEQKNSVKSSRSNVGTSTELIDYLRLLFEKIGHAYCPNHHTVLERLSPSTAAQKLLEHFEGERGYILVPVERCTLSSTAAATTSRAKKSTKKSSRDSKAAEQKKSNELLSRLLQEGFLRIFVPSKDETLSEKQTKPIKQLQGEIVELSVETKLPQKNFYIVVDRLAFNRTESDRLADSLAQAYRLSLQYNAHYTSARCVALTTSEKHFLMSEKNSCSVCSYAMSELSSALFSFNSPVGACESCKGFGNILQVDEAKVIPDPKMTIAQGALKPFTMPSAARDKKELFNFCKKNKIDLHTPWCELSPKQREVIWKGTDSFWGVMGLFEYLETKKYKMHVRVFLARYKSAFTCSTCHGSRLKPEALQVKIQGRSIADYCRLCVDELAQIFQNLELTKNEALIAAEPLQQIRSRLSYLQAVGLGYLTLDRPTKTLSGGEFQRMNLSNQLGIGLSQTLYVLDEPTIGLHPRDNDRLIKVLHNLNQIGNTLVIVEHDQDVIKNASHIIEMGPGSGRLGGDIIYSGVIDEFYNFKESVTVPYLKNNFQTEYEPRPVDISNYRYCLEIKGARGNNLKNIDVKIPLHRIVTVTGVSGSGKSSLISDTLYPALARYFGVEFLPGLPYDSLEGQDHLKNVLFIDQSPIGGTARSNPVTYMKIYDAIRTVMATCDEAKMTGITAGQFSLNVDGGRCPTCKGLGVEIIDMMFMDDIEIPCDACDGKKFRAEILDVRFRGKNINDILNMTVSEAMDFFVSYPNIRRPLSLLREVGLDYITLGQSSRSLSGGESQRLKVAREFHSTQQNSTLYILDEPTTGLHFKEVQLLMKVLNRLVEAGGSVLLIEHNLDVIRQSDYLIDLGPEAAQGGGQVVAAGTPAEVKKSRKSLTARYL